MRNAPVSEKTPVGVFVGLATLDVIHRIAKPPAANQKITSNAQFVAAGGPAANAAVTFAALGGQAILVTALGVDPVAELIRADLAAYGEMLDASLPALRAARDDTGLNLIARGRASRKSRTSGSIVFLRDQSAVALPLASISM